MKHLQRRAKFVLCVRNDRSEDLEPRKLYQVLPDRAAGHEAYVRVVDESGEDYLYPAEYFVPIRLPAAIAANLASPSSRPRQPTARAHQRPLRPRSRADRS